MSSIFFILLSVAICLATLKLRLGALGSPGPGIYPLLLGLILLVLSIVLFVQEWFSPQASFVQFFQKGEGLKLGYFLVAFSLSLLIFERVGFVVSIFILMVLLFKGIGDKTVWESTLYGLIISVSSYLAFTHLLGVRLPKGILRFW